MTTKVLSIIPARAGSKGLKYKNKRILYGKPLISWTIEASINSEFITDTLISSDDEEILSISKTYPVITLKRPAEFSSDTSSSEQVVYHAIKSIKDSYDFIILLQPTSPLRSASDINNAFKLLFQQNADGLISMYEIDNKILKSFIINGDGCIQGVSNNEYPFQRRQDLPKTYMSNGAIYIISTKKFLKTKSFYSNNTIPYIMSIQNSLDIDTEDDLNKAELILHETL